MNKKNRQKKWSVLVICVLLHTVFPNAELNARIPSIGEKVFDHRVSVLPGTESQREVTPAASGLQWKVCVLAAHTVYVEDLTVTSDSPGRLAGRIAGTIVYRTEKQGTGNAEFFYPQYYLCGTCEINEVIPIANKENSFSLAVKKNEMADPVTYIEMANETASIELPYIAPCPEDRIGSICRKGYPCVYPVVDGGGYANESIYSPYLKR
jgi:hypothetical protein